MKERKSDSLLATFNLRVRLEELALEILALPWEMANEVPTHLPVAVFPSC